MTDDYIVRGIKRAASNAALEAAALKIESTLVGKSEWSSAEALAQHNLIRFCADIVRNEKR